LSIGVGAADGVPVGAPGVEMALAAGMAAEAAERQAKIERDAGGGG